MHINNTVDQEVKLINEPCNVLEYLSFENVIGPNIVDCFGESAQVDNFKSNITNKKHIVAFEYWLALVQQQDQAKLPKWSTFKPMTIAAILADLLVVELEGDNWLIKIVGENLNMMLKSRISKGGKLNLFDLKDYTHVMSKQDELVRKFHCPILESGVLPIKGRQFLKYTSIMLPFRIDEEDVPNKMITVVCPYVD